MTVKCKNCKNFIDSPKDEECCSEGLWFMLDGDYPHNRQQLKNHINDNQFCSEFEQKKANKNE